MAQLAEQLTCNQQVIGSSPIIGLAVLTVFGPLAQLVRATGSYPVGPGFKSLKVHFGLMAQLVRAPPCHGGGRGFESRLGRLPIKGYLWDLSSAGRASALQAEGHRFEPYNFHFIN